MVEVNDKPAQGPLTHGLTLNQLDTAMTEALVVSAILSIASFATEAEHFINMVQVCGSGKRISEDVWQDLPAMPDFQPRDLGLVLTDAAQRARAIYETLKGAVPVQTSHVVPQPSQERAAGESTSVQAP